MERISLFRALIRWKHCQSIGVQSVWLCYTGKDIHMLPLYSFTHLAQTILQCFYNMNGSYSASLSECKVCLARKDVTTV